MKRGLFPFGGGNIGLVQEVVAPEEALSRAIAIAEVIAAQAPPGIAATLRSARLATQEGADASMRELLPELQRLMGTEDAREGLASFMERRAAVFTGR